ncbi:hypothetical protein PVAG01_07907 [Phlyctema vagabunda]|uniref:EF-hand domain-containing protein n=1 Tax=Phlyctema vagabunda TaxID=108571 RepID=A0ABR4PE99_9HELO
MAGFKLLGVCAVFATVALGHGGTAHQKPLEVAPDADWATRHMAEEHHIGNFDPGAFFSLHDYDASGDWDAEELLTTYGMKDETAKHISEKEKHEVATELMRLLDQDSNGHVTRDEWMNFCQAGKKLPDFGLGPGHHGDSEYEYEIHHWEKYHDENTKEEDLIHPEDIEHFKKHDEMEDEADRIAALDRMPIVEANIPAKFRRE